MCAGQMLRLRLLQVQPDTLFQMLLLKRSVLLALQWFQIQHLISMYAQQPNIYQPGGWQSLPGGRMLVNLASDAE